MPDLRGSSPVPAAHLVGLYRRMLEIRRFEEEAIKAVNRGEIPGGVHTSIGQEAEIVGACLALRDDDVMTGTHRSHGHVIAKGAPLGAVMAELMGKQTGVCAGRGGSMHLTDIAHGALGESGIVGGMLPIAVGAGLSAKLRRRATVSLAFLGDGAANSGAFHESLNLAAVWKLPVVFVCENNLYALTTPMRSVTAVGDVAARAAAYDMPGVIVDGQDVLAVYGAVSDAVARARRGDGPSLVEAKTYRFREHAEFGSLVLHYRTDEEIAQWKARDPIALLRSHLVTSGAVGADVLDQCDAGVEAALAAAMVFARESELACAN